MKTAMTPLSFARIRPFFSLWTKTTLMRQASQYGFPLLGGEGYLLDDGFCDFAFGYAQNDRVGGILRKVKVFRSENLTKRKFGAMCTCFWLIHVFSIEQERLISCSLLLHTLINWILLPISHLTLMSFCTQGLPGVAESTVSISHRIPFKVYKL